MIQVLGDRVLVALPPRVDEIVTASGLVLMKDPDRLHAPTQGIVMLLGEKTGTVDLDDVLTVVNDAPCAPNSNGEYDVEVFPLLAALKTLRPAPFDVAVGDCVVFPRSAGEQVHLDGVDYVILRESEILGVVEPKESAA